MYLESTVSAVCQVHIDIGVVTLLGTLESFHAFCVFAQTTETKVLETDNATVGDASQVHRVVPNIMVILHPLVAIRATIHETSDTSRIVIIRWQTKDVEALTRHFSTRVFIAICSLGSPFVVLHEWVVAGDAHLTTLGNRFLVPGNLHRSNHWLTGIAEATWWTMVEHVPLTIDFLQGAVSVMSCVGGDEFRTVCIWNYTTRINEHTARTPRTERGVSVCIAQGTVRVAQSVLLTRVA